MFLGCVYTKSKTFLWVYVQGVEHKQVFCFVLFCLKLTKVVQSHFFSTEKYARISHFSLKQTLKNSAHSLQEELNKKSYFYRNLNVESFVHCCIHPFFCASKVSATVH